MLARKFRYRLPKARWPALVKKSLREYIKIFPNDTLAGHHVSNTKSFREGVENFPNDTLAGRDGTKLKSFREVKKIFPNDTLAGPMSKTKSQTKNLSER